MQAPGYKEEKITSFSRIGPGLRTVKYPPRIEAKNRNDAVKVAVRGDGIEPCIVPLSPRQRAPSYSRNQTRSMKLYRGRSAIAIQSQRHPIDLV